MVITIIVMLILVGVSISMSVNGGLFEKAGEAVGKTNNALIAEKQLAEGGITVGNVYYASIDDYINRPTANNLYGVWKFNDEISTGAFSIVFDLSYPISFVSNNCSFAAMSNELLLLTDLGYEPSPGVIVTVYKNGQWEDEAYRIVDFGTDGQEVSEQFFVWLSENATYQK